MAQRTMIRSIALALTVAAISTGAAAQSSAPAAPPAAAPRPCSGWTCGAEPIPGSSRGGNTNLLDGCVIDAIGRLPKADGLKVTKTSYEYRDAHKELEFWYVVISVDLQGRQSNYVWLCRIYANNSAQLVRVP